MAETLIRNRSRLPGLGLALAALILTLMPARAARAIIIVSNNTFTLNSADGGMNFYLSTNAAGPVTGPPIFDPSTGLMSVVGNGTSLVSQPTGTNYAVNGGIGSPGDITGLNNTLSGTGDATTVGPNYGPGSASLSAVPSGTGGAGVLWTSFSQSDPGNAGESSFGVSRGDTSYSVNSTFSGSPGVGLGISGTLPGPNEAVAAGLFGTFTWNSSTFTTWVAIIATTDAAGQLSVQAIGPAGQLYSHGTSPSGDSFTAYAVSLFDGAVTLQPGDTVGFSGTLTLIADPPSSGPIFQIDPFAFPDGSLPPGFIGAGAGAPVPEPSTLALLGVGGMLGLGWRRSRRRRAAG